MHRSRMILPVCHLACASQVQLLEQLLMDLAGVWQVYVNPDTEMVFVTFDPALITSDQVQAALERSGYGPPAWLVSGA